MGERDREGGLRARRSGRERESECVRVCERVRERERETETEALGQDESSMVRPRIHEHAAPERVCVCERECVGERE